MKTLKYVKTIKTIFKQLVIEIIITRSIIHKTIFLDLNLPSQHLYIYMSTFETASDFLKLVCNRSVGQGRLHSFTTPAGRITELPIL